MSNLTKTTDATQEEYKQFAKDAANTANEIGALTLDVIKSTTEWSRLGYTLQQSAQLAKQTTIYQNVGDIKSAEDASTALIAAIKGFGIEVDDQGKNITHLVDVYNEVGNKFSISSAGIGEAAKRSASALSEAGNTMEESIALITAANSSVQDPEKVGNAMKTLSLRLRGISEDGEDVSDLVPTLEDKFNSLGLTLKKDGSTFKSTYEIFQDLSKVWGNLSDFQKADILELVAGKEQANVASSLIANWQDSEAALEAGLNSFGSAARENETYLNSLQGHIAQFKNAVSSFWSSNIESDSLKQIVDIGTTLIGVIQKLTDTFGLLPLAITSGVLIFSLFNNNVKAFTFGTGKGLLSWIGLTQLNLTKLSLSINRVAYSLGLGATGARVFTVALTGLVRAFAPLAIITGVTWGISELIKVLNEQANAFKNSTEQMQKNNTAYSETKSNLESTLSFYKENHDAIQTDTKIKDQLYEMQNRLIDTFGDEAEGIDLVNGKYDEQIDKIEALNKKTLESKIADNQILADAINDKKFSNPSLANGNKTFFNGEDQRYTVSDGSGFGDLDILDYYKELLSIKDKIQQRDVSIFAGEKLIAKTPQEWANALSSVQSKIDEIAPSVEQLNSLESDKKNLIKINTDEQNSFNQAQQSMFEIANNALSSLPTESYAKGISGVAQAINSFDGKNLSSVVASIKKIPEVTPSILREITNALNDNSRSSLIASNTNSSTSKSYEELAKEATSAESDLKNLNQALYDLNDSQKLSSDTISQLVTEYPELLSAVRKTANGWEIEKTAIDELRNSKIELIAKSKAAEAAMTSEIYEQLQKRLKAYGLEIDSITDLATAREVAAKIATDKSSQSDEPLLMGGSFVGLQKLTKEAQETVNLTYELGRLQSQYQEKYKEILSNPNFGVSSSSSSSKKTEKNFLDATEARINEINREADARATLNDLTQKRIDVLTNEKDYASAIKKTTELLTSQQKQVSLLNAANAQLNAERNKLDASSKYKMTTWTDSNGEQTQSFVKDYNNLAGDDKAQKALQEKFTQWQAFTKAIIENKQSIDEVNSSLRETSINLDSLKLTNTQIYLDKQNSTLEEINYNLEVAEKTQSLYAEGTSEYNQQQVIQNKLTQDKIAFIQSEIAWTEQRLKQGNLTNEQIKLLNDYLKENRLALLDAQNAWIQTTSSTADQIVSNYKEMLQKERDLKLDQLDREQDDELVKIEETKESRIDAIEESIKAEEKRHKAAIDNLDDELDSFNDIINAQLKSIDRQTESDDYNEKIQDLLTQREDVQAQYDKLLKDNSYSAKAKRVELEKQLASIDKDIASTQSDRETELKKQALQDQLSDREDYIDSQKDLEDDAYDSTIENLNSQKEAIQKFYDDLTKTTKDNYEKQKLLTQQHYDSIIENETYMAQLKQDLMSNDSKKVASTLGTIRGEYDRFFAYLTTQSAVLGETFSTIVGNFKLDEGLLDTADPTKSGTGTSNTQTNNSSASSYWTKYLDNKKQAEALYDKLNAGGVSATEAATIRSKIAELKAINDTYRAKYNFIDGNFASLVGLKNNEIFSAKTGGMTPSWGSGGKFLLAHEKEIMLNKSDTTNLLKIVDVTRNIIDSIKGFDFRNYIPTMSSTSSNGTTINGLSISVTGTFAQKDGDDVIDSIIGGMKKKGVNLA